MSKHARPRKRVHFSGFYRRTLAAVTSLVLLTGTVALAADDMTVDGDALTTGAQDKNVSLTLSAGASQTISLGAFIDLGNGNNHVDFPVTVSITKTDASGIISSGPAPTSGTITAYGVANELATSVTVTAPSAGLSCGADNSFTANVEFEATGDANGLASNELNNGKTAAKVTLTVPGPACATTTTTTSTTTTTAPPTTTTTLPDTDGDGFANAIDNCPTDANPGQADADNDGLGDVCDSNSFAPEVLTAASNANGNEGSELTTSGAFADQDGNGTLTITKLSGAGTVTPGANGGWSWSYTPSDDGSGTVVVEASDGEHAAATDSFNWTAVNVAPTVSDLSGLATVNENSTVTRTYTYSIAEPGDDTVTATPDCGTGNTVSDATNSKTDGSFKCTFPDGNDPAEESTVSVYATDSDLDQGNTATFDVTVNNVAPTGTFNSPASDVNEGSSFDLSIASVTDPSAADTAAGFTYAFDCGSGYGAFASASSKSCSTTDDATLAVGGKVKDKDGGISTYTASVTVVNVAPTVSDLSGIATVNENSTVTRTYTYSIDEPGNDTVTASPDCGTSNTVSDATNTATSGSFKCTFHDGLNPAVESEVSVYATDDDGGTGNTDSLHVTVNNVAPTGTFNTPAGTVNEGSNFALSTTEVTDPSAVDTDEGFEHAFDCGAGYSTFAAPASETCSTTDDGTLSVGGKVRDKDLDLSTYTDTVTVVNVAPTVSDLTGATTVDESSTATHTYTYSINEPGDDTVTATPSCGTGNIVSDATNSKTGGSFKCTFPDGHNPAEESTVSVYATDDDDAQGNTATLEVTVNNVAPTVVAGFTGTVDCRTIATLTINPDDLGASDSPWKVNITWGDGSSEPEISRTNLDSFTVTHVYNAAGAPNATVTVADKDGNTGSDLVNPATIDQEYTVTFLPPFDTSNPNVAIINKAKAGRVVPVKVTVFDDCALASMNDPSASLRIGVGRATTTNGATSDALEEYADAGAANNNGSLFRWSSDGFWIYNLDTKALGLTIGQSYRIDVFIGTVKATNDQWALLATVK
jgi:thrombospondin type 3 repeat protein